MNLSKKNITNSFNKSAKTYNDAAYFQYHIGKLLLDTLRKNIHSEATLNIVDLGSGTGSVTILLKKAFRNSTVTGIDIAYNMSQKSHSKNIFSICADADELPIRSNSIDVVFSNMMLQWSNDFSHTLHEVRRILKPKGIFVFSLCGESTLIELQTCWSKIDSLRHVNTFINTSDLHGIVCQLFKKFALSNQKHIVKFHALRNILMHLKNIGAKNINPLRHKGLVGKNSFKNLFFEYEKLRTIDGYLPMTYDIIFGVCKK